MTTKRRKLTALILATALSLNILSTPAVALEGEGAPAPAPTVVETTNPDGSKTTTTSGTTTDAAGTTTTETTKVTESETKVGGTTTETTKTETEKEIVPPPAVTTNPDGTTTTTESKTEVESTSNDKVTTDVVNHGDGSKTTTVVKEGDKETQTTEDTTITTVDENETFDIIIETPNPSPQPTTVVDGEPVPDKDSDDEATWTHGPTTDPEWVQGTVTPGVPGPTTTPEVTELPQVNIEEKPGETINETINMEDLDKWYSAEYKLNITVEDIKKGIYPEIADVPRLEKEGWTVTVTEKKDDAGNVIGYEILKTKEIPQGWTDVEGSEKKTGESVTATPAPVIEEMPETIPQPSTTTNPDGSVTEKTYTPITAADGTVIGYQENIKTTTIGGPVATTELIADGSELDKQYSKDESTSSKYIELPAKPAGQPKTANGDGTFTEISVLEIKRATGDSEYDGYAGFGDTIGYETVTVVTDAKGNIIRTEGSKTYAARCDREDGLKQDPHTLKTNTTTTTIKNEINTVIYNNYERTVTENLEKEQQQKVTMLTEKDDYNFVQTEKGLYMIYEGIMYRVTEIKDGANGSLHGIDAVNENVVGRNNIVLGEDEGGPKGAEGYGIEDGIQDKDWIEDFNKPTTGSARERWTGKDETSSGVGSGAFTRTGYGLVSAYTINTNKSTASNPDWHQVVQYRIQNGDEVRYVYCVEMDTDVNGQNKYVETFWQTSDDHTGNVSGTDYRTRFTKELRAVSLGGFWGTQSGLGSLQSVKDFMENAGYDSTGLTAGEAMAATQATIWEFASSIAKGNARAGRTINDSTWQKTIGDAEWDDFILGYNDADGKWKSDVEKTKPQGDMDTDSLARIYNLRLRLLERAKAASLDTNQDAAADTLDAEDIQGGQINVKKKNENGSYTTDLSFDIAASRGSVNNDLVLEVTVGDTTTKYRIAGTAGEGETKIYMENGKVTIPDVILNSGDEVSFKLKGRQDIDQGIIIYNNSGKQDFLGLATKSRSIRLQFAMAFKATDPVLGGTKLSTSQERTDKVKATGTAQRVDTAQIRTEENDVTQAQAHLVEKTVIGTETKTVDIRKVVREVLEYKETVVTKVTPAPTPKERTRPTPTPVVTPTPTPTVTPTPTPETTPTPTPTATPTPTPERTPTPEVTPVPSATPTPGPKQPRDGRRPTGGELTPEIIEDEPVPLGGGEGGGEFIEILDEDVPLAAVPDTGNADVLILMAMSITSLGGAMGLTIKKKEDEE